MIITKENSKKQKPSMQEAISLEDVIGLDGFNGYMIHGPKFYIDNYHSRGTPSRGKLVLGPGSVSPQDISLVSNGTTILSFASKDIKGIGVKKLNVMFFLRDGTSIEFFRG